MNSADKALCFLRWACFLIVFTLGTNLNAQDWNESWILDGGGFEFNAPAFLHIAYPIVDPDPSLGELSVDVVGNNVVIEYDPYPGAVGIAEFVVEYFPGPFGNFSPSTKAFRLYIDSSHVITKPDFAVTEQDSALSIPVLLNDSIMGSDSIYIQYLGAVKNGVATITADGQGVDFQPDPGFAGIAHLTYVAMDNFGASSEEHVTIQVISATELPDSDTIFLTTDSRSPIEIYMPTMGFELDTPSGQIEGSVDTVADGIFLYTPDGDFDGTDEFNFVKDSTMTRTAQVRVFYQPEPNEFLIPDIIYTRKNEIVIFDARANDLRTSYNIYTYTEPSFGILSLDDNTNFFTYEPEPGFEGAVQFKYSMNLLGKYEETTVTIYVGNMAPVNEETYKLTTYAGVPIVLNYEIPIEGYDFYINASNPLDLQLDLCDPAAGLLELYSGANTISVLCDDDISGYDMIVFTPADGFTGTEDFQVLYCADTTDCTLLNIEVTVQDFGETGPCPCVDNCVWPGDANANGRVDMEDLLTMGWFIGKTGESRNYQDNSAWLGQHANDWNLMNEVSGMNVKYSDCDGDGVITTSDSEPINEHFLKMHTFIPDLPGLKSPYPFFLLPRSGVYNEGDTAEIDIVVGTDNQPVIDMHGIQFALNLPTDLVDSSSLNIEFAADSWLAREGASHDLQIQPWDGRIDAAITRVDGKPASGFGIIGTMTFIVEDDIEGFPPPGAFIPMNIEIISAGNSDTHGNLYDMDGEVGDFYFRVPNGRDIGLRSSTPSADPGNLHVFPNPASGGKLNVVLDPGTDEVEYSVYDLTGKLTLSGQESYHNFVVDVSSLANGMYFLQVITDKQTMSTRFEVHK